ncbi:unnamed protein product, partial [Prorocentrum cordatum]
ALPPQAPGLLGMQPPPSVPYFGPASFISWNVRALFCLGVVRMHRKLDYLCRLASAADVVMIQEAHSNLEKAAILDARGLDVLNVHIDPMLSPAGVRQVLSLASSALAVGPRSHAVLCGDFNFDSHVRDRLNCLDGQFCGRPGAQQAAFEELFPTLAEFGIDGFTHRNSDAVSSFSRLDLAYSSLHPTLCMDMTFNASVFQAISSPNFDLSDHVPIVLSFRAKTVDSRQRPIPLWITRHPTWPIEVDKIAMRLAAHEVKELAAHHRARTSDEELWWLVRALRAIRADNPEVLDKCCKVVESITTLLDTEPADLTLLLDHVAQLSRRTAEERLRDVGAARDLPEYARRQQTARLARLVRTWAPIRRTLSLRGVRDSDGQFVHDEDEVFLAVAEHWQPVFAEKQIDAAAATTFIDLWARRFPTIAWALTFDDFCDMIRRTSDSGCGPDGIPYSAWKFASSPVQRMAEPTDHTMGMYRHPKNLRPLSLSNTDVKLLALSLNAVVSPALPAWARPEQRGFINDRMIIQNVLDVEELYRDNDHFWYFKGIERFFFTARSGINQGCPFSAALFVLAMDPFVAALSGAVGPRGYLRVYADDIAIVMWQLVAQIRRDECVIVPLWNRNLVRVRTVVMERVAFWSSLTISLAAKYFGFSIGPDSRRLEWPTAIAKFWSRATDLLRVTEGLPATMTLHNTQGCPILYYQVRHMPQALFQLQDDMVELLTRGPRCWVPVEAAYSFDSLFRCANRLMRLRYMIWPSSPTPGPPRRLTGVFAMIFRHSVGTTINLCGLGLEIGMDGPRYRCRVVKALLGHCLGAAHRDFLDFLGLHTDFGVFARQALGRHATKAVVEATRLNPGIAARYSAPARVRADLQTHARLAKKPLTYKIPTARACLSMATLGLDAAW